MLRALFNLCLHPLARLERSRAAQGRFGPQFTSFMRQTNRKRLDTDLHDAVLRGRKIAKNLFRLALAGGFAWVLLESAKALSVF